eukprot:3689156-Rhodomonas_salina.1
MCELCELCETWELCVRRAMRWAAADGTTPGSLWEESGYIHIHATKPHSLGHALTDSPIGLAA